MNINELINITEELMIEYNIEIRDTWTELKGIDLSQVHKGCSNDLIIKFLDIKDAEFAKGIVEWNIPGYKGCLYAKPIINISKGCKYEHVLVHEIAHFLQYQTKEENDNYIRTGKGYITQRIEKEAYFIQMKYMIKYEKEALYESRSQEKSKVDIDIKKIDELKITDKNVDNILIILKVGGAFNF